ncbi:MAG: DUF5063 domain-containing protein [Bacteroidota bacterium]
MHDQHPADEATVRRLALLCDQLALIVPRNAPPLDEGDYEDIPERNYAQTRQRVSTRFPMLGLYNTVVDVTEQVGNTALATGDAIDDLTDIVNELQAVLWCWEHESPANALWHFWDSYHHHWGEHLRRLQLYLYCLEREL